MLVSAGSTARETICKSVSPELTGVQVVPPLMLLSTPAGNKQLNEHPPMPAYSVAELAGSTAKSSTNDCVIPKLAAVQLWPLSVLLKTPAELVPAWITAGLDGSIFRISMIATGSPELETVQLSAPSVLLKT